MKINSIIYENKLSGWYFHDGLRKNGNLIKATSFEEIEQEKPFVLFYERENFNNFEELLDL